MGSSVEIVNHKNAVLVKGDTRPVKETLKSLGGSWNKALVGWIFKKDKKEDILEGLKSSCTVVDKTGGAESVQPQASGEGAAQPPPSAEQAVKAEPSASGGGAASALDVDNEGDRFLQLADLKRVTVKQWGGRAQINIREYYSKDGQLLPTKKGITLSTDQWATLKANIGLVDEAIAALASGKPQAAQRAGPAAATAATSAQGKKSPQKSPQKATIQKKKKPAARQRQDEDDSDEDEDEEEDADIDESNIVSHARKRSRVSYANCDEDGEEDEDEDAD